MAVVESNAELGRRIVAEDRELRPPLLVGAVGDQPLPVAGAEGRYFWDYEGKRYLDFASQLVNVSIGHQHPKVDRGDQGAGRPALHDRAADGERQALGARPAARRGDAGRPALTFFTNGGAEANENAIKLARWYTGRHKVIARYRSYHGATAGAITLTGDPRRWAAEPGLPGRRAHARPVHVPLPGRAIPIPARSARARRTSRRSSSTRARRPSPR